MKQIISIPYLGYIIDGNGLVSVVDLADTSTTTCSTQISNALFGLNNRSVCLVGESHVSPWR